jgi:LmbE family N-acetylglucosaminyl deacetylase
VSAQIAILSPHLDDAVLSCWAMLAGLGDVLVINLFAAVPPAGTAPGWWDAMAGLGDPHAVVLERLAEDRRALELAGRRAINLDFLDYQYRDDDQQPESIAAAVHAVIPTGALVLAPGALAPARPNPVFAEPHPDHVAARTAALELRSQGFEVGLYADLPHANAQGWPRWVLEGAPSSGRATSPVDDVAAHWTDSLLRCGIAPDQLVPAVRRLSPALFALKVEAVRCYATQLDTLEMGFGRAVDDPELLGYEVTWRLPAAA